MLSLAEAAFNQDHGLASMDRKEKKAAKDLLKNYEFVTWISARRLPVL